MINPLLKKGMTLHTGILGPESSQGGESYRITFTDRRVSTRSGVPTEAVPILKAFGIPLEEHWDEDIKNHGWMCSRFVQTEISRSAESIHPVVEYFLKNGLTNNMFLSLLKEV